MAMAKPVYNSTMRYSNGKPTIVFVPSHRQAQLIAIDIMTYCENLDGGTFLGKDVDMELLSIVTEKLKEQRLQQVVKQGIGFVHDGMSNSDWEAIVDLYNDGTLNFLVSSWILIPRMAGLSPSEIVPSSIIVYNFRCPTKPSFASIIAKDCPLVDNSTFFIDSSTHTLS